MMQTNSSLPLEGRVREGVELSHSADSLPLEGRVREGVELANSADSLPLVGRVREGVRRVALIEFFGIGGTADYTDCLATALSGQGIEVAVVTSSLFQPLNPTPGYRIVRPFRYRPEQPKPLKAWRLARAIGPARDFLADFQPEVVHAQGTVLPAIEGRLFSSLSMPTVCTVHDARAHERRPWLGSFTNFYRRFDRLICHSQFTRRQLAEVIPDARINVVPHGSYSPLVGPPANRTKSRERLGLPLSSRVALFFGFIRPYKGLDLFLDSLALAASHGHDIRGVVAGRPLYDIAPSMARARRAGIPVDWHLRFLARAEFATYFAAADVVALPYLETFDSGALELAAAFGKPVVVSDAGGLAEAFNRYGYGAVLPERTPEELAQALVADYPVRPTATEAANSWTTVSARTADIYREAIGD